MPPHFKGHGQLHMGDGLPFELPGYTAVCIVAIHGQHQGAPARVCLRCAGTKAHLEAKEWNSWAKHLASGAVGAVSSAFVRVPTDTLRHRVQAYLHPNLVQAVPQLVRTKGLRGFYSGFLPTITRDVPEIALQFGMYEALRAAVQWHAAERGAGDGGGKLPTWQHLVLGGAAGAFATSVTMPIDVIKTHLQCGDRAAREAGPWRTFTHLCANNRAGLWAGMVRSAAQTPG